MPLNALFSMEKLISVAIQIFKMSCMKKRMISDSDKIPFLWSLLTDPSEWSLFFIFWSLFPVFSDHSSQKLLKVVSFIFKGGISIPGWLSSWENLPKNYSPGRFSLKVLTFESKHIWDSFLMVAETTYDCSGKFTKCCGASHWLPWASCPSVWQLRRAFGGTHSFALLGGWEVIGLMVVEPKVQVGFNFDSKSILWKKSTYRQQKFTISCQSYKLIV